MNQLIILLASLCLTNPDLVRNEIRIENVCVQYSQGGYYIKYDLTGNAKNGHVIVDLTYHDEETDIELRPDLDNIKGDIGTKFIRQGRNKTIFWDVSSDAQAPYREGRIILTPTLVLKGEVKDEQKLANRTRRLSERQKKIESRLNKRGLTSKEIEKNVRYIAVSNKLEKTRELNEVLYLEIKEESKRSVLFPTDISIFDYCDLDVVNAAKASESKPTSLEDLTDKVSYRGLIYSEDKIIELGFDDVISFTSKGNSIVSSIAFVRTKKDIVTIRDSRYEITWGCGIALHIVFDKSEKIQKFSSFKNASAYLRKVKGKNQFNFQTLGLVGGDMESKISSLSEAIDNPDLLQDSVHDLVDWNDSTITKTPMVITYKRL